MHNHIVKRLRFMANINKYLQFRVAKSDNNNKTHTHKVDLTQTNKFNSSRMVGEVDVFDFSQKSFKCLKPEEELI